MEDPKEGTTGSHAFFAALTAAALVLAAVPRALPGLAYVRHGVRDGEWWRLVTGHLVHGSAAHLVWNVAGLALVWLAFGTRLAGRAWTLVLAAAAAGTGLGVLALAPEVAAMAGLSGVLHGLAAAGAIAALRAGERLGWTVLALLAAKVAWEQLAGGSAAAEAALGGAIAVDAHLYGLVSGAAAACALVRR
jgi:rhomboid family GlyGly-CTERM serine protease